MHLDHEPGRVARDLVKLVDVLRDERMQLLSFFELNQREVAGIWAGRPRRAREAVLPRSLAHLGVGEVVADVGHLLRHGIARPQALRAAKVRDARIGGDAGAGERHDASRLIYPGAHLRCILRGHGQF
jgi:hypothetical protein